MAMSHMTKLDKNIPYYIKMLVAFVLGNVLKVESEGKSKRVSVQGSMQLDCSDR